MNRFRHYICIVISTSLIALPLRAQEATAPVESTEQTQPQRHPLMQLGEMMERDWADRPEWAQMATMILKGEEMGPGRGWFKPGENRYTWDWLMQTFDADKNGTVALQELGDGEPTRFLFDTLDRSGDGGLTAADFEPGSAAGRSDPSRMMASVLVRMLDSDSNGKITPEELSLFFLSVDEQRTGFLTVVDFQNLFRRAFMPGPPPTNLPAEYEPGVNPLRDLDMLLSGQYGALAPGPSISDMAPDFTLRRQDGTGTVTLSQMRGKPVALIFGSFT